MDLNTAANALQGRGPPGGGGINGGLVRAGMACRLVTALDSCLHPLLR